RDNAPTLIPVDNEATGKKVKGVVIVLNNEITLKDAKSVLWRRECHINDKSKTYRRPDNPTSKHVLVEECENFCGVENVIYTSFIFQDEYRDLTPEKLTDFAIKSILSEAGKKGNDGIRYLLSAKNKGIKTKLSDDYEKAILKKTKVNSLNEAIEKLDKKRQLYPGNYKC
ncbi:unnamed protein product, partial [marine sediment metagenome]